MPNPLYNVTGAPGFHSFGSSAAIQAEFRAIATGFDKFPSFAGQAGKPLIVNAGETGFDYAVAATYLSQTTADQLYLFKAGDTASGPITTAVDAPGFKSLLVTNAGNNGFQVFNEAGIRKLEMVFFGLGGAGGYGAPAGSAAINASGATGLTIATADTARMVIDGTGHFGFGAGPGAGVAKFFGNYVEFLDGSYHGYLGAGSLATGAAGNALVLRSDSGGPIVLSADAGGSAQVTLNAAGQLGIGAAPFAGVRLQARVGADQNVGAYSLLGGTTLGAFTDGGAATGLRLAGNTIVFAPNGSTDKVTINAAGMLGVGVSPAYALDILGSATTLGRIQTTAPAGVLRFASNGLEFGYVGSGTITMPSMTTTDIGITSSGSGALVFGTGNVEKARITAGGNFGIGNQGPIARFHVSSAASSVSQPANITDLAGSMRLEGTVANTCYDGLSWQSAGGGGAALVFSRDTAYGTSIGLYTNPVSTAVAGALTKALGVDPSGTLTDRAGLELGYKVIPPHTSYADGASVSTTARGMCITGGYSALTVPNGVFARGDSFMIYVDGSGSMSLIQGSGVTMRLAGSTTTGTRTVAARGLATVWFNSASECIVSGAGVS